jgi:transposase InsO family protein
MSHLSKDQPTHPSKAWPMPYSPGQGTHPRADWQIDFTNMPKVKKHQYLLVLVDTFSGWVEAFPTSNKRASTVASIIVSHIIPRFGMPTSFQSDNGPGDPNTYQGP